jgi:hypothetical protein
VQIHVEDLAAHTAAHTARRERDESETRWAGLMPAYEELAGKVIPA